MYAPKVRETVPHHISKDGKIRKGVKEMLTILKNL
jgi:hypothetical protein